MTNNTQPSQQNSPFRFNKTKNEIQSSFTVNGVHLASMAIRHKDDKTLNRTHAALFVLASLHQFYGDPILSELLNQINGFMSDKNKIITTENSKN